MTTDHVVGVIDMMLLRGGVILHFIAAMKCRRGGRIDGQGWLNHDGMVICCVMMALADKLPVAYAIHQVSSGRLTIRVSEASFTCTSAPCNSKIKCASQSASSAVVITRFCVSIGWLA